MSGFNANFRNAHDGSQSTFNGEADQRGSGNPGQIIPPVDGFLTLECGDTVDSEITDISPYSFFRTQDVIANTRFRARQANMVVDVPGRVTITVTTGAFTPFISIFRTADDYVISSDGSGEASINVTEEDEGPLTIEVTSIEPYARGDFTIHVSCGGKVPTTTMITASPNPSALHDKVTYTVTVTANTGIPSGDVTLSDDSGTLSTVTLVAGEGTYTTARQPVGSHTVVASYPGDATFESSTGQVVEVITSRAGLTTCPTGDLQVDATMVTFINDYITWRRNLPGGPYGAPADFTELVPWVSNCTWNSVGSQTGVLITQFVGPNSAQVFETSPNTNTFLSVFFDAFSGVDPTGTHATTFSPAGFSPSNPPNWPPPATITITFA